MLLRNRCLGPICLFVAAAGLATSAYAVDGYVNDFSSLQDVTTWSSSPGAPIGPPYLNATNSAVLADVENSGPEPWGYQFIDVGEVGGITGAPFDCTNGVLTVRASYDYTGGATPPTGPLGCWIRVYSGEQDPVSGEWTVKARAAYFMWIPVNGGWEEILHNLAVPGAMNYYNGGTAFDPTMVYRVRADFVWWDNTWVPCTLGIDHLEIEKDAAPIANAGPNQTLNVQGCQPVNVQLDGTASIPGGGSRANQTITEYNWYENNELVATGPTPTVELGPGIHTFELEIICADGVVAYDTVQVTITASGLSPLPVNLSLTQQINNHPQGEPSWNAITFGDGAYGIRFSQDGVAVDLTGGDWYFGPIISLDKACYQVPIDVTQANMRLKFSARYNQDFNTQPYQDAPINVRFVDVSGEHGSVEPWLYGPQPSPTYPAWKDVDTEINLRPHDPADPFWTSANFDPTQVQRIEFYGTDWFGTGFDYVEVKNLWLGVEGGGVTRGDLNCDGLIDNEDIDPFVLALTNPAGYQAAWPNCNMMNADITCDGLVDNEDIDPFVVCITTGTCPPCP